MRTCVLSNYSGLTALLQSNLYIAVLYITVTGQLPKVFSWLYISCKVYLYYTAVALYITVALPFHGSLLHTGLTQGLTVVLKTGQPIKFEKFVVAMISIAMISIANSMINAVKDSAFAATK